MEEQVFARRSFGQITVALLNAKNGKVYSPAYFTVLIVGVKYALQQVKYDGSTRLSPLFKVQKRYRRLHWRGNFKAVCPTENF